VVFYIDKSPSLTLLEKKKQHKNTVMHDQVPLYFRDHDKEALVARCLDCTGDMFHENFDEKGNIVAKQKGSSLFECFNHTMYLFLKQ
jgi:hypothetical protein